MPYFKQNALGKGCSSFISEDDYNYDDYDFEREQNYVREIDHMKNESIREDKNILKLQGIGQVSFQPNVAIIRIGVVTENKELTKAQQENALISERVLTSLKNSGVDPKDISTDNYSITPQYDYIEGKQIFRGYRVENTFKVTLRDIKAAGTVIDNAVSSGANQIGNISFSSSNTARYYDEALLKAMKNAVIKAISFEKVLNIKVLQTPINITEISQGIAPIDGTPRLYMAKSAATPIEPGQMEISASLFAEFKYVDIV